MNESVPQARPTSGEIVWTGPRLLVLVDIIFAVERKIGRDLTEPEISMLTHEVCKWVRRRSAQRGRGSVDA